MSAFDKLKLFYPEGQMNEKDIETKERLLLFRKDVRIEIQCQAIKKFMEPSAQIESCNENNNQSVGD